MTYEERLNEKLREEFNRERNYYTLERYVMSELLSPIEDYISAIEIIKGNEDLIEGLNLYYIATYLSTMWFCGADEFLEKLNSVVDTVSDIDKAIIYYLNADYISYSETDKKSNSEYKDYLLKSIQYSSNVNFVNNWLDLARILEGEEARKCMIKARENIEKIDTMEEIKNKPIDYWLTSQRYIEEFILGTHILDEYLEYTFV